MGAVVGIIASQITAAPVGTDITSAVMAESAGMPYSLLGANFSGFDYLFDEGIDTTALTEIYFYASSSNLLYMSLGSGQGGMDSMANDARNIFLAKKVDLNFDNISSIEITYNISSDLSKLGFYCVAIPASFVSLYWGSMSGFTYTGTVGRDQEGFMASVLTSMATWPSANTAITARGTGSKITLDTGLASGYGSLILLVGTNYNSDVSFDYDSGYIEVEITKVETFE